jgi:1-deoxy-D-xylulose 5-phosphate reductoisomerase
MPPLERAEIASQSFLKGYIGFALIPETIEEMLMKDHRVHGDEFFALEAVDQEAGSAGIIELAVC